MATKTKDYTATLSSGYSTQNPISVNKKTALIVEGITNKDDVFDLKFSIVKDGNSSYLLVTNSDATKGIKLSNYSSIKYIKTDIVSSKKYALTDIIANSLVDNTANVISSYNKKKLTVTGATNYNDKIDMSLSGYVPTGTANIKKNKGLTINGGKGNDEITGTAYNDTITGGKGENIVNIDVTQKFGNDTYKLTSGEKLNIVTNGEVEYSKDSKGNVVITKEDNGSLTITGLAKKDITQGVTINGEAIVFDFDENNISKNKITGTAQNDEIDVSSLDGLTKTVGKGKNKHEELKTNEDSGLTINAKTGNDTITATKYSDTITGGAGENIIVVKNEKFGNDTINLTKGEKLTIDMTACGINNLAELVGHFEVKNKDLVLKTENGTLTFKNFAKSNVVGQDGEVKIKLPNDNVVDLNYDHIFTYNDSNVQTGVIKNKKGKVIGQSATLTGNRFSEAFYLGTSDFNGYKRIINTGDGENNVTVTSKGEIEINGGNDKDDITVYNNDAATNINAKNGNNKITIQGSTGVNNINAGSGNDTISLATNQDNVSSTVSAGDGANTIGFEGKGNNTIISGKHDDTINVWTGTTNTTIKAGAGRNTINISNSTNFGNIVLTEEKVNATNVINFRNGINANYTFIKNGNDLIIQNDTNNSKIQINDYYLTRTSKTKYAEFEFQASGTTKAFNELLGLTGKGLTIGGSGKISGTENSDNILANDFDEDIKASNDTITGGKGDDIINAGRGNNLIKFSVGDGADIIQDGKGTDTLVFAKGVTVLANYVGDNLVISYGNEGDTITLNNYTPDHSVKNIKIGDKTKTIDSYLPQPEEPDTLTVAGANLTVGTDEADILDAASDGVNKIFAGDGNDTITTGSATNYIYGGKGDDVITLGSGTDYIYGGGGSNKIYIGSGSGSDYTFDENDNTFVFTNISNLNNLEFTMGSQGFGYIADLIISGYGNSTDTLTIRNFFNTEGYDYSKIKLQAGTNGDPVSLYELINESNLKTAYLAGTWKDRPKSPILSPAQYAPQIDSVIYGNTPGAGSHNVLLGTAGGDNTFYSGGNNAGIAGSGVYGKTMIYGGDGDETFHTEGNKIYFNDNGTLRTYEKESIYVVDKPNGTKEVNLGVYYRTSETETPIGTYEDYYEEEHPVFYTEDPEKIAQISDDDKFEKSFVYTVDNNQYTVNYITSSVLTVEGGGGNDTFYTGFGATGGDGNDTIIGSGIMYGSRGDDKFVLTDEYKDSLSPEYHVYTNSGNDYIDTTNLPDEYDDTISINFGEGVNTVKVDGKHNIEIAIATTSTFREEEPVNKKIETVYSYQARNTHYWAFVQNGDLYIVSNNSNKSDSEGAVSYDGKGAGVLIIEGWGSLTDGQKDKITIGYRESHATSGYTGSTYTIGKFLKILDGTSDLFIDETKTTHTYIDDNNYERLNETYKFNVINNSDGTESTINEDGTTQTAIRNIYNGFCDSIIGTEERSVDYFIIGGNGAQTIRGGDGNDVIYGDNINGHDSDGNYISSTESDGADTIYGGKGSDYLIGGGGADFINGGSGTDYLDGGDGNDTLVGGTLGEEEEFNISLLTGRFSLKEIHGGNGNDKIYSLGVYTDDVTFDEANSRTYLGGSTYFTNNIYAGEGNDEIHANAYRDMVYAGKGNDTIYSYAYAEDSFYDYSDPTPEIYGEEGDDHIILKSHADVKAYGGAGNDIIDARESSVVYYNTMWGDRGNDTIYGSEYKDIIFTGVGNNYVEAGGGDDEIYGSDTQLGQGEDNIIKAGAGNDSIRTSGSSKIYGESGNDTIYFATGYNNNVPSNLYIDGGAGDDTYISGSGFGFDTIVASTGNDVIEFKGFVKDYTSYQYNGNDLVLSYRNDGYPSGLIFKDYKLGRFSNFTIKTYGGYDEGYSQNGQYSMTDFIKYLDGQYSMATTATNGDDIISATGNIDALGGNDFILAHSSTSTYNNPQVIKTGTGNNSVLAQAAYTRIEGGNGDNNYGLQGSVATIVDAGGNNTVTVASQKADNVYYDITLNGNGNNTITSADNADYCAYKITATGSGKQTIDIDSAEFRNHPVTNEQLFTTIKTGAGDDEIKLDLGSVEAGAGDDTITVRDGAGSYSGADPYSYANLKGEAGNDTYIIEGGHDWMTDRISADTKVLITDTQGNNEIKFTSEYMSHDNLNLLLNVKADGTLAEFKHYVSNLETGGNDIEGTGYSAFICGNMDLKYLGNVANASCNGWDICDGVKFADTGTVGAISRIEAYDGYYITSTELSTIIGQAAAWLTSDGREYGSVWDAIKPGGQNDFNQGNYDALYEIFNNPNNWTQGA